MQPPQAPGSLHLVGRAVAGPETSCQGLGGGGGGGGIGEGLHFAHSWMQLGLWFQLGCSPSVLPHCPPPSNQPSNQPTEDSA